MDSLNVYALTYIDYNKEKKADVIARSPEEACENLQRRIGGRYRTIEIVELQRISKDAIFYKTPKRKRA